MTCSESDFSRLISMAKKVRKYDVESDGLHFSEEGMKLWAEVCMDPAMIVASAEQQKIIRNEMQVSNS